VELLREVLWFRAVFRVVLKGEAEVGETGRGCRLIHQALYSKSSVILHFEQSLHNLQDVPHPKIQPPCQYRAIRQESEPHEGHKCGSQHEQYDSDDLLCEFANDDGRGYAVRHVRGIHCEAMLGQEHSWASRTPYPW
jgi:hypothetical protein